MPVNNNHQYEQYDGILKTKLQYMFKSKIKMEVKKNSERESEIKRKGKIQKEMAFF